MQRHHLLPLQLRSRACFSLFFDIISSEHSGFDDFRRNGLLLPSSTKTALKTGLPMHRGPHRVYSEMVTTRVGQIEAGWSRLRGQAPELAQIEAVMRLGLLQKALRKRLLGAIRWPIRLNRKDPHWARLDFTELDAMAEGLWAATDDEG